MVSPYKLAFYNVVFVWEVQVHQVERSLADSLVAFFELAMASENADESGEKEPGIEQPPAEDVAAVLPPASDEEISPAFAIGEDDSIDVLCGECEDDEDDGRSAAEKAASALVCFLCEKNYRAKSQIFCAAPCAADVRGAMRDAAAQGPQAKKAFGSLRRSGGPNFKQAIQAYKAYPY